MYNELLQNLLSLQSMKTKSMVYIILLIVIALVAVGFALPAIKMHNMLSGHWSAEPYSAAEFGVEDEVVALKSADGLSLTAYEVAVEQPKGVVICLGGIHSMTATKWYGHSRLFADNGYASLLLDLRAHGGSSGDRIYAATREWMDVAAAVAYIVSQERYRGVKIAVMGLSMGAATAVVSAGKIGDIDALIALSSYSSWEYNFNLNVAQQVPKPFAQLLSPFVNVVTRLRFGGYADITPENQITNLGARPALLVQSVGDKLVPFANFERLTAAAPQVEQWVVEGDNHCIIEDFVHPQTNAQYCERIVEFLNSVANDRGTEN